MMNTECQSIVDVEIFPCMIFYLEIIDRWFLWWNRHKYWWDLKIWFLCDSCRNLLLPFSKAPIALTWTHSYSSANSYDFLDLIPWKVGWIKKVTQFGWTIILFKACILYLILLFWFKACIHDNSMLVMLFR